MPIAARSFHSCHKTRSRCLEETTDALFREIDNGNLSDVEGEDGSSDSEDEVEQPELDDADREDVSGDDDFEASTSAWRRRTFVKAGTTFHGEEFVRLEAE